MAQPAATQNVLVVEDSRFFTTVLKRAFQARPGLSMVHAASLAEARALLDQPGRPPFLAALVDVELPDASLAEALGAMRDAKVPVIAMAEAVTGELREQILSFDVVDYVAKQTPSNIDVMLHMLGRLARNVGTKALVVDDSRASRLYFTRLLEAHRFRVLTANNGPDALAVVERNPDIRVTFVDYDMPGMDGCALIRELRRQLPREMLAIVGIAAHDRPLGAARMMKHGASDYINKPFEPEELYTRLYQNLETQERTEAISAAATQLKEARGRADEAGRFKTAMLAALGNDLQTPLKAVLSYSDALLKGAPAPEQAGPLGHIREAAAHMQRLCDDLADAATAEAGRLAGVREKLDVGRLVEAALSMVRPQAEAGGIALKAKIGKLPEVRSDSARVRQILVNLLSNAVKFTAKGGSVTVEAKADQGGIGVAVSDTGAGMTAKELAAAFDTHGDLAARKAKGLGLGLALTKGLVEALGGTLTATSKPGKGTTMRFTLPAKAKL